ncbi:RNA polymerase sigma factor [Neptunicoccus cionae]|uniref:RNA polymerase sigma factor n=1 Tax=Neptunicoccus cionae TaxID=2035344 RepID=A0A916VT76_9RHOB|nr:sigma-70 family RNA polymerase sigma factor [Amylibacter cionae]GGA30462.1 RNA polymerase sigma factor [Amylibacter cionae]
MNRDKLFDHLEDLLVYAHHLTRNRDQAEDLVQDVVLHILSRETCLSDVEHPRRYMAVILRNLFLDQTRKKGRAPSHVPIDDQDPEDENADVYGALACAQTLAAIGRLPEEYRTVMRLRVDAGLSYSDMAEQLELPIGTVMSRMSRARSKLRDYL